MKHLPRFCPVGDCALLAEFGTVIDPHINDQVLALYHAVSAAAFPWVKELVPAYGSLLIQYDPMKITYRKFVKKIEALCSGFSYEKKNPPHTVEVPVCYEGEFAPDMKNVEDHTGLSAAQIIQKHAQKPYRIYMMGFLPGFAYLGGLDPVLHTHRLETPRTKIPAGAVGIGGEQTGIYPLDSPGGWQLIGRTPLRPYDPHRIPPFLYGAGDEIRFVPITEKQFWLIWEEGKR